MAALGSAAVGMALLGVAGYNSVFTGALSHENLSAILFSQRLSALL